MVSQIKLADIAVDVVLKDIKNVHLSVYPPTGRVRISAPKRMSIDTIRVFAISKLDWIKQQQTKLREQERETPREYVERESHYLWGKRHLLTVSESDGPASIEVKHRRIVLSLRAGTDGPMRAAIVARWYREQVRTVAPDLIAKWEGRLGVRVYRMFVQQMKTRWGSCNPRAGTIRLNTELAKKPVECLEYIVVHEMVHLLEQGHNDRFVAVVDRLMPQWRFCRAKLNQLPVRHEHWVTCAQDYQ